MCAPVPSLATHIFSGSIHRRQEKRVDDDPFLIHRLSYLIRKTVKK